MKTHKYFLILDFAIQTLLLGILVLGAISPSNVLIFGKDLYKIIIPILGVWLIVTSAVNEVKNDNNIRFRINRLCFFVFFAVLVFFMEDFLTQNSISQIFAVFSLLIVLMNYILVIYEYTRLSEKPSIYIF